MFLACVCCMRPLCVVMSWDAPAPVAVQVRRRCFLPAFLFLVLAAARKGGGGGGGGGVHRSLQKVQLLAG